MTHREFYPHSQARDSNCLKWKKRYPLSNVHEWSQFWGKNRKLHVYWQGKMTKSKSYNFKLPGTFFILFSQTCVVTSANITPKPTLKRLPVLGNTLGQVSAADFSSRQQKSIPGQWPLQVMRHIRTVPFGQCEVSSEIVATCGAKPLAFNWFQVLSAWSGWTEFAGLSSISSSSVRSLWRVSSVVSRMIVHF